MKVEGLRFAADLLPHAGVAQLVEHYLAKVDVASSNLVSRSTMPRPLAGVLLCISVGRAHPLVG